MLPTSAFGRISRSRRRSTRAAASVKPGQASSVQHELQRLRGPGVHRNLRGHGWRGVEVLQPGWPSEFPNTILLGDQYVLQFVSDLAAATFYSQAQAKYAACKTLTEPFINTDRRGGYALG